MPVATDISELNPSAGLNYPAGSDSPSTLDDYLRSHAAFIAYLRDQVRPITLGGTGGATAEAARVALSIYSRAEIAAMVEQPGSMKDWPAATPPTGWLAMDGSAVSRTTYAALFAVIGTTWGAGDGSTTFNLPNKAGRVSVGAGGAFTVGATGGSADAVVVAHTHGVNDPGHSHTTAMQVDTAAGTGFNKLLPGSGYNAPSSTSATGITINSAGSSGTNANMQPYAVFLPIIKY